MHQDMKKIMDVMLVAAMLAAALPGVAKDEIHSAPDDAPDSFAAGMAQIHTVGEHDLTGDGLAVCEITNEGDERKASDLREDGASPMHKEPDAMAAEETKDSPGPKA